MPATLLPIRIGRCCVQHTDWGVVTLPTMHILAFARSGDPDEDGFGECKKYAFPLKCRPGGTPPIIRAILMQHFARGDTHFDDGFELVMAQLCKSGNEEHTTAMATFFSNNMHPGNVWKTNINFGRDYMLFDFKQV